MTAAASHLSVVSALPDGPRWRTWLWRRARQLPGNLLWRVLSAILPRVATSRMRRRAWAAGFALALGSGGRHYWLGHLDEHQAGNEAGLGVRMNEPDLRVRGVWRPFILPRVIALPGPAEDRRGPAENAWPPLVAPRRIVVTEARHAASRHAPVRPAGSSPRHARPCLPVAAARWIRQALPRRAAAGAHAGHRTLRTAA